MTVIYHNYYANQRRKPSNVQQSKGHQFQQWICKNVIVQQCEYLLKDTSECECECVDQLPLATVFTTGQSIVLVMLVRVSRRG